MSAAALDHTDLVVDTGWKLQAACRGRVALFFAPRAERPEARARREAKAHRLCMSCPVLATCREFARSHREYGFWAGESEEAREEHRTV